MSEEKATTSEGKSGSPLTTLVVVGLLAGAFFYFGGWRWLTSASKTAGGQATATLARSGDLCVQGLPGVQSLTCTGCSAPSNFSDAGPGDFFSCRGGRVAYATDVIPGRAVQVRMTDGKPPVNFTFAEFDKPVTLGPAQVASTAGVSASPTIQPGGSGATIDQARSGGSLGSSTQATPQVAIGQRTTTATTAARGQIVAGSNRYRQDDQPVEPVQPTPEPVRWVPVRVELCQNNRPGRDACTQVPAQAAGYWYCVADADLPGYARIDYMKAGTDRYDRLTIAGGFTCGGVRSP